MGTTPTAGSIKMKPTYIATRRTQLRRIATTLALLLAVQAAYADPPTYCAINDAQFVSALQLAQSTSVTIKLMQGTYHLDLTPWNKNLSPSATGKFSDGSNLLGGYTNTDCSLRNVGVDNTIITDTTINPDDRFNIFGDATIEGITFKLPNGMIIGTDNSDNDPLPNKSQLTIRRNVFTDTNKGSGGAVGPLEIRWNEGAAVGGTLRLVNNLLHDNSSSVATTNAAAIFFQINSGKPKIELIHNTVVNNSGTLGGIGMANVAGLDVYAYNNIFYANTGKDLAIQTGDQITLVDNVIGTHSYAGTLVNSGNTTANPKLDADFKPIESPISNVINSASASVIGGLPTTDLRGRARQIGSAPDRGAFESSINDSTTQTVTTTADSGLGSLRSAIASANGNSGTLIVFDLGPNCPYTINLQSRLPDITAPMTIAGYTQAGSSQNDLTVGFDASICVVLNGSGAPISDGLYVPPGTSDSVQLQVSGLAFSGFTHAAISMYSGSAHTVTGIRIGGNTHGVALDPVRDGIILGPGVHDVKIGDGAIYLYPGERNIIGDATGRGIVLDGANDTLGPAHDNYIKNNYIGVGWTDPSENFTNRGNGGAGIVIAGYNNDVESNFIEYNGGYGIDLTSAGANNNYISLNWIGYLYSPISEDLGSGNLGGVLIENGAHDNDIVDNLMWFNFGAGIRVLSGQGNSFKQNKFRGNEGLGIDLAAEGVMPNDNDTDSQPADYANRGLNFPVITQAIGGHTMGTFTGTLTTAPGDYYIEVFVSANCDPSGYGEADVSVGGSTVTTGTVGPDGQATASFSVNTNETYLDLRYYDYITATATDTAGNTSEISQCVLYTDDTIFTDGFGYPGLN